MMNAPQLRQIRQLAHKLARQLTSIRGQDTVDPDVTFSHVQSVMQLLLDQLAQTGSWGEANRIASNELWRIAGTQLSTGSLQEHARAKPRGYAGDFELLEKIDADYRCHDPLGRAFDRFFQQQAAPEAVRNRVHLVAEVMAETIVHRGSTGTHLMSVGSGPALDVARAVSRVSPELRQSVRVTLIDIDPEALDNATERLRRLLPPTRLMCARENLFRLSKNRSSLAPLGKADLLSCTGLFDYLDDDSAVSMLTTFWQHLTPGGTLLAFNFAPANPSRAYMEWIGQWYLIYREPRALEDLAKRSGIDRGAWSVDPGPLGICPYLRATAPAGRGNAVAVRD